MVPVTPPTDSAPRPPFDPPRLAVYCGSRHGARPEYTQAARALGQALVRHGLGLVYGGGKVGLMGEVADAVLERGGEVIGVIPQAPSRVEVAHAGLTTMHVVDSMHTRKKLMTDLAAGFVALPGGVGTLDELFEALSWAQLRIHAKPIGILDVAGYWDGVLRLLDHGVAEGFLDRAHRDLVISDPDPDALIARLAALRVPPALPVSDAERPEP